MYCIPPLAQLVEQIPLKDKVAGSIPAGRTREKECGKFEKGLGYV